MKDAPLSEAQMRHLLDLGDLSTGRPRDSRQWQPPEAEALQKALPAYVITGFLARGGMGAVYRGQQTALNREVAIKVLPPACAADEELQFATRFKQEAQAMARLSHPHIVAVYDAGETTEGLLYYVMELVEGTDLGQQLAAEGRLPPDRTIAILSDVCEALAFAHAEGIIHRDIKPSNILVDRHGRIKVADFGLAKLEQPDASLLTHSDVAMGSPHFIAPEACIAGGRIDARADLYAVGVLLYQMLTGEIPRGRFPPPSTLVAGLHPKLDAIVDRALQADPAQRFASAGELRTALQSLPSEPLPSPRGEPSPRPENRRRALPLAAGLAAALLVSAGTWSWLTDRPSPGAASSPNPVAPAAQPAKATRDAPFVNSLGMKFVPVPGTQVLFCIHETRWRDYAAFAGNTSGISRDWQDQSLQGYSPPTRKEDHPVWRVSWEDTKQFCAWLSRQEGRSYRLPTDAEWSLAVGLADLEKRSANDTPEKLSGRIRALYPWGTTWPPPVGAGNYHDQSSREARLPSAAAGGLSSGDYADGFPLTAPVMSFPPNIHGLHDLGGNVWEWVEDWFNPKLEFRVRRGGGWCDPANYLPPSSYRIGRPASERYHGNGFRIVLVPDEPAGTTAQPARATRDLPFCNSLGMRFAPVPGTRVLFCIHETRRSDYAIFAEANPGMDASWRIQDIHGVPLRERHGDHPVRRVSWEDAHRFCTWLSFKEGAMYRLPTDAEWSLAVGLADLEERHPGDLPKTLNLKVQGIHPWGDDWPPRGQVGNYHDLSSRLALVPGSSVEGPLLQNYADGFPTTSPVMSYAPNALGLHDLGGNVWEFVEEWFDEKQEQRTKRGGSWLDSANYVLLSSHRSRQAPTERYHGNGFRVVRVAGPGEFDEGTPGHRSKPAQSSTR